MYKSNEEKRVSKTDEIMDKLEQGMKELFVSERYKQYLATMAKFHRYSFNNSLLIALQKPDATFVAGYTDWQKKFGRQVNKGEKGISIIAPAPYKKLIERDVIDPVTNKPLLGADGRPVKEKSELIIPAYQVVTVFDVSQTDGKPLPTIGVDELQGDVDGYKELLQAIEAIAVVPIVHEDIEGEAKGYFSPQEQKIAIKNGLSQEQEIKTIVHEEAHSLLHNQPALQMTLDEFVFVNRLDEQMESEFGSVSVRDYLILCAKAEGFNDYTQMYEAGMRVKNYEDVTPKIWALYDKNKIAMSDMNTKEVQAESVAFAVCHHFGIDTSDYSFGYIAGWSSDKEGKELQASMNIIRKTADELITKIEQQLALRKQKTPDLVPTVQEERTEVLADVSKRKKAQKQK